MTDLFGNPVIEDRLLTEADIRAKRRKAGQARGNYKPVGSGPEGETCGSCSHAVCHGGTSKNYWKCDRIRSSHGPGTDIRLKWAACEGWERKR